ncbi:hypothetical protein DPMN_144628 [Dreissena polymorpha]|uniref:Uncharacterized protein n=1 Tax=Dreissena polymorpha TaxID=45954 RepID=A0A9D4J0G7_DREPO|nr:hypothetical protein DPMN_144628 [Dreissena polymorpha]
MHPNYNVAATFGKNVGKTFYYIIVTTKLQRLNANLIQLCNNVWVPTGKSAQLPYLRTSRATLRKRSEVVTNVAIRMQRF